LPRRTCRGARARRKHCLESAQKKTHQEEMMADTSIDPKRLVFPGLAALYDSLAPYAYDFMRFSTGAVLFPHGVQKVFFKSVAVYAGVIGKAGFPIPATLAVLVFFVESVGALCLAIGLFTRLAALMIWIEMTVIILAFQWRNGYFWTDRGIEYALLWWLLCIAIFFRGGGPISVDRLLGKEL
jgi:putative oxidoreductase